MVKASEGETYSDPLWVAHSVAAAEAGFMVGSYHVFRPEHENPKIQADLYWSTAFGRTALFPVLDFELRKGVDGPTCMRRAAECADAIEQRWGKRCAIYASPGFLDGLGPPLGDMINLVISAHGGKRPLWLADYRTEPHMPKAGGLEGWSTWDMWQFSGGATDITGRPLDLSWFRGTDRDLALMGAAL